MSAPTGAKRLRGKSAELQSFSVEELEWLLAPEQRLAQSIVFGCYLACLDAISPIVKGCDPVLSASEAKLLISRARSIGNTSLRSKLENNCAISSKISKSIGNDHLPDDKTRREAVMLVSVLDREMKLVAFRPPWR